MANTRPDRHRRHPLGRRAWKRSRERTDHFGGEIVIALVTALIGAVWEASHEAQTKTHLLLASSWTEILTAAVIGAIAGLLLVRLGFLLFSLAWYPLRGYRSKDWEPQLGVTGPATDGQTQGGIFFFDLVCLVHPPIDVRVSLGYMECLVIDPHGDEHRILDSLLAIQMNPVAVSGKLLLPHPGKYTVHWYATYGKGLYEITRKSFHIAPDWTVT